MMQHSCSNLFSIKIIMALLTPQQMCCQNFFLRPSCLDTLNHPALAHARDEVSAACLLNQETIGLLAGHKRHRVLHLKLLYNALLCCCSDTSSDAPGQTLCCALLLKSALKFTQAPEMFQLHYRNPRCSNHLAATAGTPHGCSTLLHRSLAAHAACNLAAMIEGCTRPQGLLELLPALLPVASASSASSMPAMLSTISCKSGWQQQAHVTSAMCPSCTCSNSQQFLNMGVRTSPRNK
jgi:hypothetical protein